MSKGKTARNTLKALAFPLQRFIAAWGGRERISASSGHALPAPYQLAALRGEGILRERFFGAFMQRLPVQLDAAQQVALWHELVESGGHITEWVQRLGIAKALRREAALPADANPASEARTLYAALLDALHQQQPDLLPWAVEGFFWHLWRRRFPDAPLGQYTPAGAGARPASATEPQHLRERLAHALRKQHHEAVQVKESFEQSAEGVCFALLVKRASSPHWQELVQVQRPRLKTARLAAYQAALQTP